MTLKIRVTDLCLVAMFFAMGFGLFYSVGAAYGSMTHGGVSGSPIAQQSPTLVQAEAACAMVKAKSRTPVSDCGANEWKAFDMTVPVNGIKAAEYCDAAARDISANFKLIAGKNWKLYLFSNPEVRPTAVCRVP